MKTLTGKNNEQLLKIKKTDAVLIPASAFFLYGLFCFYSARIIGFCSFFLGYQYTAFIFPSSSSSYKKPETNSYTNVCSGTYTPFLYEPDEN